MTKRRTARRALPALTLIAGMTITGAACAQSTMPWWNTPAWHFGASVYAYLPKVDGNIGFPSRGGDGSVTVPADSFFDDLNGAFMGSLEASNGTWGVFTDYLYLDISGSKGGTRDFTVGNSQLPASVSGNFDLALKGSMWTIAGTWRVVQQPGATVDLLAGARLLDVKPRLNWSLSGDLSTIPIAARGGNIEVKDHNWDGIIGVKARYAFGPNSRWYMPLYGDIGTGDSDLTWQVAGGVGYSLDWADIIALWRYVKYDNKNDQAVESLSFNGPMIGLVFRW